MENIKVGDKFGRLTVISGPTKKNGRRAFSVSCECGETRLVMGYSLSSGNTKSCGCLSRETAKAKATKHGMHSHPLYSTWDGMMARCYNKNAVRYCDYGGRGITVCDRWHDPRNFIADMGDKPAADYEIDRKDNNGNYEPGNVRWATRAENARNLRVTVRVMHNGIEKHILDAAKDSGIHADTLRTRIARNDDDIFRPLARGARDVKKKVAP